MRLAGQALSDNSKTSGDANEAINRALEMFAPEDTISSHHVDLDTGREGIINDGIPK